MTDNSLVIFTKASQMLMEANTIQKAKELKDLALTAQDWAKRKGLGEDAVQYCRSYAMQAQIKMGEMLAATERARAGRKKELVTTCDQLTDNDVVPTLEALGISKRESSESQMLAALPKDEQQKVIDGEKKVTEVKREVRRAKMKKQPELPTDKYRIIYADPPWSYGNTGLDDYGHAERHYPSMSISELCDLPIKNIVEENAVLFLWVTSPLLEECFPVIKAWGFKYKTSFVWDKIKHNFGHYNSVRHEFLLVCTRGSCTPDHNKLFDSVVTIERTKTHSQKPEQFREIIETIYTKGKKLELFAREQADGWDNYGNEAQ